MKRNLVMIGMLVFLVVFAALAVASMNVTTESNMVTVTALTNQENSVDYPAHSRIGPWANVTVVCFYDFNEKIVANKGIHDAFLVNYSKQMRKNDMKAYTAALRTHRHDHTFTLTEKRIGTVRINI